MSEPDTEEIVIPEKHRARFDQVKAECKEADPGLPEPPDELVLKSLLDTWEAVGTGYYATDGGAAEHYRWTLLADGHRKEEYKAADKAMIHELLVEAETYLDDAENSVCIYLHKDKTAVPNKHEKDEEQ